MKHANHLSILKNISRKLAKIGFEIGYGDDNFWGIDIWGPFVRIAVRKKSDYKEIINNRNRILELIESFYQKYPLKAGDYSCRLILRKVGIHGDFFIVNQNADIVGFLPARARTRLLKKHLVEFKRFNNFLQSFLMYNNT